VNKSTATALLNKNVFSLVLIVLRQSHGCTDSGRLFQTIGAHTLKAGVPNAVVDGTARCVRDDILVTEVRAEIKDDVRTPGHTDGVHAP